MQLSDKVVQDLMEKCLHTKEELEPYQEKLAALDGKVTIAQAKEVLPPGTIFVEGIVRDFVFHPGRVAEAKDAIREMLDELPDSFKDGFTFLSLCQDRHGTIWTGLQRTMEGLVVLAIAAGLMEYCMPKALWPVLPGSMPYVQIKSPDAAPTQEEAKEAKTERFLHVRVLAKPEVVTMANPNLDDYQKLVGGLIERVPLEEGKEEDLGEGGVDLWCNENGIAERLGMNRTVADAWGHRHHIYGDFFIARADSEGNIVGLTDEDIGKYTERFS